MQKANEFITIQEPWKKYKDEATKDQAINDIKFLLYVVKNLAILSSAVLVDGFAKIQEIYGNVDLQVIDTTTASDSKKLHTLFVAKQFEVNLDPQIIYPRVEE